MSVWRDNLGLASRPRLLRGAALLGGIGFALVIAMTGWFGLSATLSQVRDGLTGVPGAIVVHLAQLVVCGIGWGALLPVHLPVWQMFRARWLREAVNSMLPVANLGGSLVGARLLTRDPRIDAPTAAASAAADITGEAVSQLLFLFVGLGIAATLPHAPLSPFWIAAVIGPLLGIVAAFVAAQAFGVMGLVERLALRILPARLGARLAGLQLRLAATYANPGRVTIDVATNFAGWSIGSAEVWILLHALGHPVSFGVAYVIESLGLVARSLAFAVPAGLAAQETGFVLAAGLFGIPHEAGLALSLLKRVRELTVGVAGVLTWQWLERRVWLRR